MHRLDPGFAKDDPRGELFRLVVHLRETSASRDQLVDAAVWASALYDRDLVAEIADSSIDEALEVLIIAAHDGFACECCGYHTLELPPTRESWQVCTVCGWEDRDPMTAEVYAPGLADLDSAQVSYEQIGACASEWLELVEPPTERQAHRRPFRTIEARRLALLEVIEEVFAGVKLAGGSTMEDARASDDYDSPRPEYDYQRTEAWTDIEDDRVGSFHEWIFLDNRGAFFYLVAAMRFTLTHRAEAGALDSAIASLLRYRKPEHGRWLIEHASSAQLRFIVELIELVFDPWLRYSRWDVTGGWRASDYEVTSSAAAALREHLLSAGDG